MAIATTIRIEKMMAFEDKVLLLFPLLLLFTISPSVFWDSSDSATVTFSAFAAPVPVSVPVPVSSLMVYLDVNVKSIAVLSSLHDPSFNDVASIVFKCSLEIIYVGLLYFADDAVIKQQYNIVLALERLSSRREVCEGKQDE